MTIKLLAQQNLKFLSLKGGCTGLSKSTQVKMPHCWKSHVAAHIFSSCKSLCGNGLIVMQCNVKLHMYAYKLAL